MVRRGGYLRHWEAARYLGISVETVYEMLESGELPGERVEGRWRIDLARLEQWLDEEVSPGEIQKLAQRLNVEESKVREFLKKAG